MNKRIGRIISSDHKSARAEFNEEAMEGMLVSITRKKRTYIGKIERVESRKFKGLTGYIYWLDYVERPFPSMTPIYIADEELEAGHIYIGNDLRDIKVKLKVNPLFGHVLVAGMTTAGKTHWLIVLLEELGSLEVPCLVIDPQGEMVNMPIVNRERYVVVEDLKIENLIPHMQQKKIVIYNLLGCTKKEKVARVSSILEALMLAKERDYQQAQESPLLLNLLPILVIIDEADIFAPNLRRGRGSGGREAVGPVVELLERGSKFGLGAVVATQRITRLDIDVRSQCNSAIIFRLIDNGSIQAVHTIDYIPKEEINRIKGLRQGQCIVAGQVVSRARRVYIRDIATPRAKNRDFEEMLGIDAPEKEIFETRLVNEDGDIVDRLTGEVIHSGLERLAEGDRAVFEADDGDGVVLRSHITPEEQRVLKKLRKPDKNGERLIG